MSEKGEKGRKNLSLAPVKWCLRNFTGQAEAQRNAEKKSTGV